MNMWQTQLAGISRANAFKERMNAVPAIRRSAWAEAERERELMVDIIRRAGPMTSKQVSEETGIHFATINDRLRVMAKRGEVRPLSDRPRLWDVPR